MPLTPDDIARILDALDKSSWDQAEIVVDGVRIAVGRDDLPPPTAPTAIAATPAPEAPDPAPAPVVAAVSEPAPPAPQDTSSAEDHVVPSPSVGVFWRSPSPGAPPFVDIGSKVEAGDTIGIVEVMKLMSNVAADRAGTVTAVFPANAEQVEYGTPLVAIRPDA
ncbi:biotin/lipoyl-containing protein [Saccharomonospora sp. NPDC046836]|uniref:acetyl-CoA carboxylase biotin carboxyl carrier protein n=1 Tax=Saccharomonospora sp. NPDC046836 TaxID=3156921 RepID=UPI0034085182